MKRKCVVKSITDIVNEEHHAGLSMKALGAGDQATCCRRQGIRFRMNDIQSSGKWIDSSEAKREAGLAK